MIKIKSIKYTLAFLVIMLTGISTNLHAQALNEKPPIDTGSFSHWRNVDSPQLSNDGQYSLYTIRGGTEADVLVICSNTSRWKTQIGGMTGFASSSFSHDSKYVFFLKPGDTLGMLNLHKKVISYLTNISGFQIPKNGNWIAYKSKGNDKLLTLFNTQSRKTLTYSNISNYLFNEQGTALTLQSERENGVSLTLAVLPSGETKTLFKATKISQVTFDATGTRLAFIASEQQSGQTINTIYYYQNNTAQAEKLASGSLPGSEGLSVSDDRLRFSKEGDKVLFRADTLPKLNLAPGAIKAISKLDIWNYKDHFMQATQYLDPDQYGGGTNVTTYYMIINLADRSTYQINKQGENIAGNINSFENFVFVRRMDDSKTYYFKEPEPYYLVSTKTGNRTILDKNRSYNGILSPDEKYVVWFDADSAAYFSFETATGIKRNISKNVPAQLYRKDDPQDGWPPVEYGIAAWSAEDNTIFLHDNYDIWRVDLRGEAQAINITGSLGRKDSLIFGLVNFKAGPMVVGKNDALILSAYSKSTRDNGFYSLTLGKSNLPEKLSMGRYAEFVQRPAVSYSESPGGMRPLKARGKDVYLISRESASASPNFYVTKDFKQFNKISDVRPEKDYNWLTSELVNWQLPDGRMSQGILYKPENFDPSKKYPVIFNYYEKWSERLNRYQSPDWTEANINIPYFVSNGYLVFCPDIYYRQGHTGQGALDALVSASTSLGKLPYVDYTKMGIQGHSFGGFETNFIVTHSNIFAAACSVSGPSNEISGYYQENGINGAAFYEIEYEGAPYGTGVTPYTYPELYIENSPALFVDKSTTPLLIVGGDQDPAVLINDDLQMYAAMNRAEKKVWLLEYNESNHAINGNNGNDSKDLTLRMKQFFDHYLKGATPPIWMTRGVPAATRAEDTGLEFDYSGAKP